MGFEGSFSLNLVCLLINIVLHTRIKFGDMVVSHISTWPYKVAYVFMFISLLESMIVICVLNIHFSGNFLEFVNSWKHNGPFNALIMAFELCKITWIVVFIQI